MRKIFLSVMLCLIYTLVLTACAAGASSKNQEIVCSTDQYTITTIDGRWYMNLKPVNTSQNPENISGLDVVYYPKFTSIAEMKEAIESGSISSKEITGLQALADAEKSLEIFDLSDLYEAVFPPELSADYILFRGKEYLVTLDYGNVVSYISFQTESDFQKAYAKEFDNFIKFEDEKINLLRIEEEPQRNATRYYYSTAAGELMAVYYTIVDGDKTLHVKERYVLKTYSDNATHSETAPETIEIYGTEDGAFFVVGFYGLSERPSVEWLSQFGAVQYKEAK